MRTSPLDKLVRLDTLCARCECALDTLTRLDAQEDDASDDWDAMRAIVAEAVATRQATPLRVLAHELETLVAGVSSGAHPAGTEPQESPR
jgi:hypothetical protein